MDEGAISMSTEQIKGEYDSLAHYFNLKDIPYCHLWDTPYGSVELSEEFGGYMQGLHLEAMTMDHSKNTEKKPVRYYEIAEAIDILAGASLESGVEIADIFKNP
jgi:hypothetical protein